jgi:GLPGLI family protein
VNPSVYKTNNLLSILESRLNIFKMKKIKLLILVITIYSSNLLEAQKTGSVIYKVSLKKTEKNKTEKNKYKFIYSLENIAKKFDLKLVFSKNESFYEQINPMKMTLNDENLYNTAKIVFNTSGSFFYKLANREITEEKEFSGEKFLIKKKVDITEWELTNIKKKIGNYICYKATRNYKYESRKGNTSVYQVVWYCPEIPYSFGPGEFVGFPGLVIRVEVGNIIYSAKKIQLKNNEKFEIKIPNEGQKVTEKEFKEIAKKARISLMRNQKKNKS